jgi:tetratricopeptide (TPR) repeat protein
MSTLPITIAQELRRAISAYKARQLIEAEQLCQHLIRANPDLFDALHLLAVVQSSLGKKDMALASYDRALRVQPDSVEALNNRGVTLQKLKRSDEALASYDRALAVSSNDADALYNRGNALKELKRFEEAVATYDRALAVRPRFVEALSNRGNALNELNRFDKALVSFESALALQPQNAEILYNRGNSLQKLMRFDEALASYDRALSQRPGFVEALSNRGNALSALKRFKEALASYDGALTIRPSDVEALYNRGNALRELKRFEEALTSYDRALTVRPDCAEALSNRGSTLKDLKRFDEALESYENALAIRPDYVDALCNRGVTLKELKRFDEALASYDRALTVRPDDADAHYNQSMCLLLLGEFERGWKKYQWRWKSEQMKQQDRRFSQPLWLGAEDVANKTILLHAEQGFGDTIQFSRYLPLVATAGARVVFEVQAPLRRLMGTLPGVARIVSKGDALPDFDLHCPLLSLPLAFATRLETIPNAMHYLSAPAHTVIDWQRRLGPKNRPRIGLVWSGSPQHKNDPNRSIRLSALLPLLDQEATFVSLQKDVRSEDAAILQARGDLRHFGHGLKDFADTAALITNLDLLISVDTSVVHLAGALAKPVWVLLPFIPDWRWLLDRDDSPWYPTATLFRQDDTRSWDKVIARIHTALSELVQGRRQTPPLKPSNQPIPL